MDDVQNQYRDADKRAPAVKNDEIDLLDYLRVVWRYRWMILAVCAVATSLTVVMSLRTPRQYQSTVTIVPPLDILQRESGDGRLGSLASPLLRNAISGLSGSVASMYVEILGSREVADSIIDRFHLMDAYGSIPYRSSIRMQLKANTKIATTSGGAVRITVTDGDPNRSAAIANAYVEELDRQNKRLSTGQATAKRVFLENRLKEMEGRLSKIDDILSREARMQEMLVELLTRECEIAKIEEAKSMPTIQVLDSAIVPETRDPRGTIRKTAMAGVGSFMFALLVAFAREYFARMRSASKQDQLLQDPEQDHIGDGSMEELESKRRIVGALRRKSSQNSQLHWQEK